MKYLTHITTEGERWDEVAYAMYGDAFAYEPIIAANPLVPIRPALAGGIKLRVPVRDVPAAADVPPWKRP